MTASTDKLPDHKGQTVSRSKVKFSGVGTGFTALDVNGQPIFMDLDEVGFFVMKATAIESPTAKRDNNGLFWLTRVGADSIAPIDRATAEKALQEFAKIEEDRKASLDGQLRLDDEAAAEEREAADDSEAPNEIAAKAAERAKRP